MNEYENICPICHVITWQKAEIEHPDTCEVCKVCKDRQDKIYFSERDAEHLLLAHQIKNLKHIRLTHTPEIMQRLYACFNAEIDSIWRTLEEEEE